MTGVLARADGHGVRDAASIERSRTTIHEVISDVDGAVEQLNQRAAQLRARGETVRGQVEQLMIAFQFQDRVNQILDRCATRCAPPRRASAPHSRAVRLPMPTSGAPCCAPATPPPSSTPPPAPPRQRPASPPAIPRSSDPGDPTTWPRPS
ncbi:hypothetical protein FSC37_00310 [Piscinibacter aquaticus]|uniref:Methyl-accepting transducer domain-containing protein n=1 Tax=Piscinibacter aquaticus TaxID=392597 RepID=A0A5C6U015_9BURK|nr:hypothetical protein FSC37_00310 [Piscinibacter aquaticus]